MTFAEPLNLRRMIALLAVAATLTLAVLADHAGLLPGAGAGTARSVTLAPSPAMLAASRGVGGDERLYWPAASRHDGMTVRVGGSTVRAAFTAAGLALKAPGLGTTEFALASLTRGTASERPAATAPSLHRNVVSYLHGGGIDEWYANGPLGLEQGIKLTSMPLAAAGGGWLTVSYRLSGSLTPALRDGVLTFTGARGARAINWVGLIVTDAHGRTLPAQANLDGDLLRIRFDDQDARYPVTIDPLMKGATLTASDAVLGDYFGRSVAESGSILAVGAPYGGTSTPPGPGSVYVFVKPASGWANASQTAELTIPAAASTYPGLGTSVAVSGTTILAGAPGANNGYGAVYVFNEPTTGWTNGTSGTELTGGTQYSSFGETLVANATTAFVGAPATNNSTGAVYVFNRPGTGWTNGSPSATLSPPATGSYGLGTSLALSGKTLVAGAPYANSEAGSIFAYTAPAAGWTSTTPGVQLVPSTVGADAYFGYSVAAGGNGADIAGGAPYATPGTVNDQGAAVVYSQPATGWSPSAPDATLTSSTPGQYDQLGSTISLSESGTILYAGAESTHGLYRFVEPASGWANASDPPAVGFSTASEYSMSAEGPDVFQTGTSPNTIQVYSDPTAPTNTAAPTITGKLVEGQKLTDNHGGWTYSPTSYYYQWLDCNRSGVGCTTIRGATSKTYKLAAGDVGHTIRVYEAAKNAEGTGNPVSSAQTGVVASSKATVAVGKAKTSGSTAKVPLTCTGVTGTSCTVKLTLTVVETLKGGKVTAVAAAASKTKTTKKTVTFASKTFKLSGGKKLTASLALNAAGSKLLKARGKLPAKLTPTATGQKLKSQNVTFKAPPPKAKKPKGKKKKT